MKLSIQLKILGAVPIITLLGMSSYIVYDSAKNYGQTIEVDKNLKIASELTKVVKELANERGYTSLFINSGGKVAVESLADQRIKTEDSIKNLKTFITNTTFDNLSENLISKVYYHSIGGNQNEYSINTEKIIDELNRINDFRTKVNDFEITFEQNFNGFYNESISNIRAEIEKLNKFSTDIKLKKTLTELLLVINTIENSAKERDYLTKPLSELKPLKREELTSWIDYWVAAENYPKAEKTLGENYFNKINNILLDKNNKSILEEVLNTKLDIMEEAFKGVYPIEAPLWFTISSEKILILESLEGVILEETGIVIGENLSKYKSILLTSLLIWSLTMIIAFLGYRTTKISENNLNKLEDLFKKVISITEQSGDIDLNSQKGINKAYRMIEQAIKTAKEDSDAAKEASLTKSLFLANMSHEIRTPLNGIIGFTNLLKKTEVDEEQEEFVNIIEKSGKNLLEIISNILDLSKIESNKIDIEHIEFDPVKEFESAVEIYAAKAAEKNIDLSLFFDPEIPSSLKGDPTKIQQVLVNLMSNAIKFTPVNGKVNIEIKKLNESGEDGNKKIRMYFSVKDSGDGIPENKQETIFESFSQADSSITRQFGGTGLGLTISKEFINLMGGKLSVESEVGKGAKFYFSLTFDAVQSSEVDTKNQYKDLAVDLLVNSKSEKETPNYIKQYFSHLGVKVTVIEKNSDWIEKINNSKSVFVLADYEDLKDCAPSCMTKINKKISVYAKTSYQQDLYQLDLDNLFRIIYEPINYSKIIRTIEEYGETQGQVRVVKQKQKTVSIDKFKANVLVCEDNPVNQKLIKRTLEDLGCTVDVADNGLIGFDKYKNSDGAYDIIFMDIQMPVMNGVESTQAIKNFDADMKKSSIPVIALTANALKGDREKFINMGLDEYTSKPLIIPEIISLLHLFLGDKVMSEQESLEHEEMRNKNKGTKKEGGRASRNREEKRISEEPKVTQEPKKEKVEENEVLDTKFSNLKVVLFREKELSVKIIYKFMLNAGFQENNISTLKEVSELETLKNIDFLFVDESFDGVSYNEELKLFKDKNPNTKIIGFKGRNDLTDEFTSIVSDVIKSNANKKEIETVVEKHI